jgi:protein phosphatase
MQVSWAAATHPGSRRLTNEDAYGAEAELGLFLVADGMGGHAAGEVASRVAVEAVTAFVAQTAGDRHHTWPIPYEIALSPTANRLKAAFILANRRVASEIHQNEAYAGMATTAVAVLINGNTIVAAHAGDSRMYQLQGEHMRQLTRDHSWVEEQVQAGLLTAEAAREHPWRNVVTRALTGGPHLDVEIATLSVEVGDRLLLCSDGLSGVVAHDEIRALLAPPASLDEACGRLIDRANEGGGPDNITVLAIQIDVA